MSRFLMLEEIPNRTLRDAMAWRNSWRRSNRRAAHGACLELIRRHEIALGWREDESVAGTSRRLRAQADQMLRERGLIQQVRAGR